jgi:hypothetical protein
MRRHTRKINTGANKTDVTNENNIKRTSNNLGNFSLNGFNADLISHILGYLKNKELVSVFVLNKYFNQVVFKEEAVQRLLERRQGVMREWVTKDHEAMESVRQFTRRQDSLDLICKYCLFFDCCECIARTFELNQVLNHGIPVETMKRVLIFCMPIVVRKIIHFLSYAKCYYDSETVKQSLFKRERPKFHRQPIYLPFYTIWIPSVYSSELRLPNASTPMQEYQYTLALQSKPRDYAKMPFSDTFGPRPYSLACGVYEGVRYGQQDFETQYIIYTALSLFAFASVIRPLYELLSKKIRLHRAKRKFSQRTFAARVLTQDKREKTLNNAEKALIKIYDDLESGHSPDDVSKIKKYV